MKYDNKTIKLKNGQSAILRAPSANDAAELIAYMKTVFGETDFLMRYPEEFEMSVEDEAKILEGLESSETSLMICCEADGKLVGNCQLSFNQRIKTAHRATIAISVLKDYWGQGIGTALFEEMIKVSKDKGVLQMELEFVEGNERAKRLYEKIGFAVVAEKPNAIRLKDGTMLKEYFMVKYL
ncbi:MAG: GNAT family N-acetyltransferase [Clostridia bacterium]|nr:GNAT family N-acetyltransferase [Clostridia bacterium]